MATKTVSTYQHPLDWFLDTDPEDADNLTVLARNLAAEPFDVNTFQTELVAKLQRLKCWIKNKKTWREKTFYDILTSAGVLKVLLKPSTLRELRKSILLNTIVERHRKLQQSKLAVDEQPLKFHSRRQRQLLKDLRAIEEIAHRNNATPEADELYAKLDSQLWYHSKLLIPASTKTYKRPHAELLSGRSLEELRRHPRDEDPWVKLAAYRTLKWKLQTKQTKRRDVSNAFLYKLAELVLAPPDVRRLSDAQIPYRDLKL